MDEVSVMIRCPNPTCGRMYAINRHNAVRRESGYPLFDCFEIACDPAACPGYLYVFYIDCTSIIKEALMSIVDRVYDEIPLARVVNGFRQHHAEIKVPVPRHLVSVDHRAIRTFRRAMNGSDGLLTRFFTSHDKEQ